MTELSIGELDSLVLKAYRGAGFSWGLSQDAGRAAAWMAMRGLPAAECFAELLQQTDGLEHSALTPVISCLLYTSPSPRDGLLSRMPSSA